MPDMNSLCLTGRLVRDMECKTDTDCPAGSFTLAVGLPAKNGDAWEDQASFFDCALYGRKAETTSSFMTKGKKVGVVGHLRQDKWEKDGRKRSAVVIVVEKLYPLSGRTEKDKITEEEMEALPW